jgi:hypothetical protein
MSHLIKPLAILTKESRWSILWHNKMSHLTKSLAILIRGDNFLSNLIGSQLEHTNQIGLKIYTCYSYP